jgi:hypothetical protein
MNGFEWLKAIFMVAISPKALLPKQAGNPATNPILPC